MDYQRIYDLIVSQARNRMVVGYTERHHVIPKFLNGSDDEANIVNLTPREHYICHVLLTKIVPENFKYAAVKSCYLMMAWSYTNESRVTIRPGVSKNLIRKIPPMTDATKELLSEAATNQFKDPQKRQRHLEGVLRRFSDPLERQKLSASQRARYTDPSERSKISQGLKKFHDHNVSPNKGRSFSHLSSDERKRIFGRPKPKGIKRSPETIAKMKAAWILRRQRSNTD